MAEERPILRGEVYNCDLGDREGSVQGGYRPVVVVQNNYGNMNSDTVIVAPVTSKDKPILPTHFSIVLDKKSIVLCEQIQTIPKSKLSKKIYYLSKEEMINLDHALRISLGTL